MPSLPPLPDPVLPLWQAAVAAPADRGAHRVLADALQAAGDPRGTWMALELRRESLDVPEVHAASRAFLFDHRHALLGPIAAYRDPVAWRTQHGLLRHLGLRVLCASRCRLLLEELDQAGLLAPIRSLRLLTHRVEQDLLETVLRRMPDLHALSIGPVGLGGTRLPVPIPTILRALPTLERLRIPPAAGGLRRGHATLRSLAIVPVRGQLTGLTSSRFPRLRHLELGPLSTWGDADLTALQHLRLTSIAGASTFRAAWSSANGTPPAMRLEAAAPDEAIDEDPLLTPPWHAHWRDFELDGARRSIRRLGRVVHIVEFGRESSLKRASAFWAADTYQSRVEAWLREGFDEVAAAPRRQTRGSLIDTVQ
jgi:hypothetical protein